MNTFTATIGLCTIALGTAGANAGLVLDQFNTSLGSAVDQNGNAVDFNNFATFARFQNTSAVDPDYTGPSLDLIAEIKFPNSDPNGARGNVGLAGGWFDVQQL